MWRSEMSDEQRKPRWLATWRAQRQHKRHRTAMDKLFGTADEDSEEKIVQRHTTRGQEHAAEDRRYRRKAGGAGGGLA
jgi:hypothetical protein